MTPATDRLAALLTVWDDLPAACATGWPVVERFLEPVAARLLAEPNDLDEDPTIAAWLRDQLQLGFESHPKALALVEEAIAHPPRPRRTESTGPIRTRGPGRRTRGMRALAGQLRERLGARVVTRHVDVKCPPRVALAEEFALVVRLREVATASSALALELEAGEAVRVRLDAPDFDAISPDELDVQVGETGDSAPAVFDLRPKRAGEHFVLLDFFQKGNPLGSVTTRIECIADAVPVAAPVELPPVALRTEATAAAPDMVLVIAAHERTLRFELRQQGGAWCKTFAAMPLPGDPAAYAAGLYDELSKMAQGFDPTAAAHGNAPRLMRAQQIEDAVRAIGETMWRTLVPLDFKQWYAEERGNWRDRPRSLLLHCDEPNLPWELLWPTEDDEPWCATFNLTRWLRRDEYGRGSEAAPTRLPLRTLAVLVPRDSGLLYADQEKLQLLVLAQNYKIEGQTPEATSDDVTRLLRGGAYDWLHVVAHGNHHATSPEGHSVLWLEGGASLSPRSITGAAEAAVRKGRPAFVFNACETGRQGMGLTGMAGWAQTLIGAGASLFAAPLWEVTDEGAVRFVADFYERLFDGEPLGEALRQARRSARRLGDPTWLAYSAYGHPNATLGLPVR